MTFPASERMSNLFPTDAEILGQKLVGEMCRDNYDQQWALEMIAQGCCVKQYDHKGATALIYASRWKHTDVALALLERGAFVDAKDDNGVTALVCAGCDGNVPLVRALLEKGADPFLGNRNGMLPSDLARRWKHDEAAALLERDMHVRREFSRWVGVVREDTRITAPRLRQRGPRP